MYYGNFMQEQFLLILFSKIRCEDILLAQKMYLIFCIPVMITLFVQVKHSVYIFIPPIFGSILQLVLFGMQAYTHSFYTIETFNKWTFSYNGHTYFGTNSSYKICKSFLNCFLYFFIRAWPAI